MKPGDTFQLLKQTFKEWSEDKASRLAASLAYYTMFSLGPLLLIVISIAGLVFGDEAARGAVSEQTRGLMGDQGAEAIETMIAAANEPNTGIVATVVGLATLLLGAAGVFGQLQDALNTIWEVKPKPGRGILGMIRDRFFSLTMVFGIGFLLLVSLVLSAVVAAAVNHFGAALGGDAAGFLLQAVNFVVGFAVITLLFALLFKVIPDAKIAWRDVWLGAAFTAFLFTIGRIAIGIYLGNAAVGSAYGAAGSLVVLLVWIYYSAQILFFGAEFTQVYANNYGSRVVPEEDAVQLTEGERAQQGMERTDGSEQRDRGSQGEKAAGRPDRAPAHAFPAGVASSQSGSSPIRRAIVVVSGVIGLAAAGLNMLRGGRDEAL